MKKSKSDGVYFFWSAAMIICVLLAVFVLMFASCSGGDNGEAGASTPPTQASDDPGTESPDPVTQSPASDPGTTDPVDVPPDAGSSAELALTEDMGQEYIDSFVFIGDSTTNGLAAYDIIPRSRVWTPSNGTLSIFRWNIDAIQVDGTGMIMDAAVAEKKPAYLLITLGVNGVSMLGETEFKTYYTEMVQALQSASPDTKIILNTMYPVSANYDTSSGISNEKIDTANGWIRDIAETTGTKFLNSASILKDETGAMIESYHNGDFIHPNADTYKLIINYIRTHGYV